MEPSEKVCANPRCGKAFVVTRRYAKPKIYCSPACGARAQSNRHHEANREKSRTKSREWHEAHRDEANQRRHKRREANIDQERENVRRWHSNNSERVREGRAAWYAEHQETQRAKMRERYRRLVDTDEAKMRREAKKRHQAARQNTPWLRMLRGAKARAATKGLPFDLDLDWIQARWTGRCELTNLEFRADPAGTRGQRMMSPSIDRIIPEKGYVKDNCRIILWAINGMKSDGTDEMMLNIAKALALEGVSSNTLNLES